MAEKADEKRKAESKPRVIAVEDKRNKQREAITKLGKEDYSKNSQLPPVVGPPIANPSSPTKIKVNFTFELDKNIQSKLPFLILALIFTTCAFIMLAKVGFGFTDVFDFQRISNNLEKLTSISFILFVILFCLAMAFATYYGFNLHPSTTLLTSLAVIIPILAGYWYSDRYWLVYIWLGFGVVLASLFATLSENLSFGNVYKSLGRALFVILIMAVLFAAIKVNGDKDIYFNTFVSSVAQLTPQLQGQVQTSLADAINDIQLSPEQLASIVSSDPSKYLDKKSVTALVALQYGTFRDVSLSAFEAKTDKDFAAGKIPATFDKLTSANQNLLVDDTYAALKDPTTSELTGGAVKQVWPELQKAIAQNINEAEVKPLNDDELSKIREKLDKISFFRDFYNRFELFVGLLVFSVLSLANMGLRALSAVFCWAIGKIIM